MQHFRCTDIRIRDIMSRDLHIFTVSTPATELMEYAIRSNAAELVIVGENGEIIGLITKKRLLRDFSEGRIDASTRAGAIMQSDVITISPESDIITARQTMRAAAIGRLPIVDRAGLLIGMVSAMHICNGFSEKLENIGNQLHTILETIAEGLIVIDAMGSVVYWNKQAEDIFGIAARRILGKKITKFIPDACSMEVLASKKALRNAYCVIRGRHLLKNSSPIFRDERCEQVEGVVCTLLDITKTVRLVSELDLAQTKMRSIERRVGEKGATVERLTTRSSAYQRVLSMAQRIAETDASVLILGESGTGKEMLARAMHRWSPRREKAFITVNSAAIPESLCESEFFGYAPGAFTGASRTGRPGKFELANGGTIFLDEIGELPLEVQAKLLRVLEYKTFYRIGATVPTETDVRIVAATNRDLEQMVRQGKFREDLYYRLNVFRLKLPPLRERREDIPALLEEFLAEFSLRYGCASPALDAALLRGVVSAAWPGNIRELRNFAERMVVLQDSEWTLCFGESSEADSAAQREKCPLLRRADRARQERARILALLAEYGNNKTKVANALRIPRSTLYYKMKIYSL